VGLGEGVRVFSLPSPSPLTPHTLNLYLMFVIVVVLLFQHLIEQLYFVQLLVKDHQHMLTNISDENIPFLKIKIKKK
jgi:hypothetical protein